MTTLADIANRALQVAGTRTTVTLAELSAGSTNEAIQINLRINMVRRKLLRMAPWNFAIPTANLTYITSAPGTPENTSTSTLLWQPGQPTPPWAYEYQYPATCIRALWIIPATQTGYSGIPITTAVTGGATSFWQGPPVKFKVQSDTFYTINGATILSGGTGHAVNDIITLPGTVQGSAPIGAPAQLQVTSISAGGVITGISVVQVVENDATVMGGSYFAIQQGAQPQAATTGSGTGALFLPSWNPTPATQRVILTNQEFAILCYVSDVTDPDLMDDMFMDTWAKILGAEVTIALTGDKKLAQLAIEEANRNIVQARVGDGNEGFTVNDVTPDWIRVRGINSTNPYSGPFTGFDWGGLWPMMG